MNLEGKVALVTGSSRGIGKAIALKLAELGSDLVINDIKDSEEAQSLKSEIESMGRRALFVEADISVFDQAKSLVEMALSEMGTINILVNNAGITRDNLMLRMTEEDFDQVIDVNLKGTFNVTKAAIRKMLKASECSIINISSVVGIAGNAGQCNYAASKAGVIGLTKSLAKEVAKKKVRVNAVAPGFIATDMTDKLGEDTIEGYKASIPLGELGEPEDISNAVAFLASDMSKYITGQVLVVDGGLFI